MNELLEIKAISSLEIAEITGKRHDAILRDIRILLNQGVGAHNFVETSYTDKSNRKSPCYNLTKKGCLILASGYDALLREKIINRWEELEVNKINLSRKELALLIIQSEEEKEKLSLENKEQQREIIAMKPKALFADAVETSSKSVLIAELAKILQQNGVNIGQNRLYNWMRENGYLCSKGEYYNQPTQKAMEMGLFELKKTTITKPSGEVIVTSTSKVSGKGQIYFINKFLAA